ncbi:MAG: DJ-1/PfpI family protein [Candidatus Pacebacteria bacterium]|nr:DJ-1/PfpI family protein [Candidatus Paceibacterota bacterium]
MKIAFIIANKDFRDEEYFITKEVLENHGIKVDTYSNAIGLALGRFGGEVKVREVVESIDVDDYSGIVFIGGSGALKRLDNDISYGLISRFNEEGKVIGAICISPVILANSGILEGKKATVWYSDMDKGAIKILGRRGAEFIDEPVVSDCNIITARDFEASSSFGSAIVSYLTNMEK